MTKKIFIKLLTLYLSKTETEKFYWTADINISVVSKNISRCRDLLEEKLMGKLLPSRKISLTDIVIHDTSETKIFTSLRFSSPWRQSLQ